MDWYRMYTSFSEDDKWETTDDTIVPHLQALYIAGCAWAAAKETDGSLPRKVARFAPYWLRISMHEHVMLQSWSLDDLAGELCLLNLWEPMGENGFRITGWLKRNISKAALEKMRSSGRRGGIAKAQKEKQLREGSTLPHSLPHTELRVKELRIKNPTGSLSSLGNSTAKSTKEVFEHWRSTLKPRAKLDDKRRKKIAARLKEGFTAEQLKQVVDKAKLSPHHSGQNDRGRTYQDIHTIFRDAAQVEAFLDGHHDRPLKCKGGGDITKGHARAGSHEDFEQAIKEQKELRRGKDNE